MLIRPSDVWEDAKKNNLIERVEERIVFSLTQKEAENCRFKMINQNTRLVECTVHRSEFSHGYRMFPIHLWDLKEGLLYKKIGSKWIRWLPNFANNVKLIKEAQEEADISESN